jgi:hypothetical protein
LLPATGCYFQQPIIQMIPRALSKINSKKLFRSACRASYFANICVRMPGKTAGSSG